MRRQLSESQTLEVLRFVTAAARWRAEQPPSLVASWGSEFEVINYFYEGLLVRVGSFRLIQREQSVAARVLPNHVSRIPK